MDHEQKYLGQIGKNATVQWMELGKTLKLNTPEPEAISQNCHMGYKEEIMPDFQMYFIGRDKVSYLEVTFQWFSRFWAWKKIVANAESSKFLALSMSRMLTSRWTVEGKWMSEQYSMNARMSQEDGQQNENECQTNIQRIVQHSEWQFNTRKNVSSTLGMTVQHSECQFNLQGVSLISIRTRSRRTWTTCIATRWRSGIVAITRVTPKWTTVVSRSTRCVLRGTWLLSAMTASASPLLGLLCAQWTATMSIWCTFEPWLHFILNFGFWSFGCQGVFTSGIWK